MDCKTARLLLAFARPRPAELDADEAEALNQHVGECPDCARLAREERMADAQLGAAVRAITPPAGLRERLLARLAADRVERRRREVRLRVRWMAVAATVFLAVGLWLIWHVRHAARLDVESIAYEYFEKRANPSPESVREWFLAKHFAVAPPGDFNYRLLSYYGLTELLGERVPLLLFNQGDDQALVYFLSDKQFDLKSLAPAVGVSGCKVDVRCSDDGRGSYLILYTGESLDRFLVRKDEGDT